MKRCLIILMTLFLCAVSGLAFADEGQPRLGLSVSEFNASPILLQHLKLAEGEGVMIQNVAVGGDLEAAGLSQGDILLAIDGHAVSHPRDVTDYISSLPHGTRVTLDVIQKGDHVQVYSVLDNLPDDVTWKYVDPVSQRQNRRGFPMFPQIVPHLPGSPSQGGFSQGGSQRMTFKTLVQTDRGSELSSVTIIGDPQNNDSDVEIEIGSNKYTSKVGDIDSLPDSARKAAHQALDHAGTFSLSFSIGGSLFDEMMKIQQDQMDAIQQMFFNSFGTSPSPFDQTAPAPQQQKPEKNKSPLRIEDPPIKS